MNNEKDDYLEAKRICKQRRKESARNMLAGLRKPLIEGDGSERKVLPLVAGDTFFSAATLLSCVCGSLLIMGMCLIGSCANKKGMVKQVNVEAVQP